MRGKAKVFCRFSDGSRRSVVLPFAWVPAQAREIQAAVEQLAIQVVAGASLQEAAAVFTGGRDPVPVPEPAPNGVALLEVWERFGQDKVRSGSIKATTWAKDYGQTGKRLAQVVEGAGNVKELLVKLGETWPAGSRRRQIAVQHVAAMLRWACDEELVPANRWLPPLSLKRFVGEGLPSSDVSVPLTDDQILGLLQGLPADAAGQRWRYALRLIAAYGLRPVEVLHLQLRSDWQIWCTYQKRSGGGTTKPRQLRALHPEWEQEWELLQRLAAGESLPPFGGGVADAARRYLVRHEAWRPLAQVGCTAYGFRHGYALRAHQSYNLSPRVAAALMGHSVETHQRVYGSWTDKDTIDSALERGLRYRQLTT